MNERLDVGESLRVNFTQTEEAVQIRRDVRLRVRVRHLRKEGAGGMTWLWSKLDWTGLRCSGGEDRFQNHSSKTKEENKRQEEGKRIENRGRREGGRWEGDD